MADIISKHNEFIKKEDKYYYTVITYMIFAILIQNSSYKEKMIFMCSVSQSIDYRKTGQYKFSEYV